MSNNRIISGTQSHTYAFSYIQFVKPEKSAMRQKVEEMNEVGFREGMVDHGSISPEGFEKLMDYIVQNGPVDQDGMPIPYNGIL